VTNTTPETPFSPPTPRGSFWKSIGIAAILSFILLQIFYVATGLKNNLTPETFNYFDDYLKRCVANISQSNTKQYLLPAETWLSAATISLTTIKQKQWYEIQDYDESQLKREINKKKSLFSAITLLASISAMIAAIGTVHLYQHPSTETWFLSSVLWFAFYIISRLPSFMAGDNIELSITYVEALKTLDKSLALSSSLDSTIWNMTEEQGSHAEISGKFKNWCVRTKEYFKQFGTSCIILTLASTVIAMTVSHITSQLNLEVATILCTPLVSILCFKALVAPATIRRFIIGFDQGVAYRFLLFIDLLSPFFVAVYSQSVRHMELHPNQRFLNLFNDSGTLNAGMLWLSTITTSLIVLTAAFLLILAPYVFTKPKIRKKIWSHSFDLYQTKIQGATLKHCREIRHTLKRYDVDTLLESLESKHLSTQHKILLTDQPNPAPTNPAPTT
jgi:membrane protein